MRDAVGGTFMIKVLLIFLAVYIIFVAVAFNYARAFRVKNKIIDVIEQNEGMDFNNERGVIGEINTYLSSQAIGYRNTEYINEDDCPKNSSNYNGFTNYYNDDFGYCVAKYTKDNIYGLLGDNVTAEYYKVTTFVTIKFPFLGLHFSIPVEGETRKIERITT